MTMRPYLRLVCLSVVARAGIAQDLQALEARFQKLEDTMRILQEDMKKVQAEMTAARQAQRPVTAPRPPAAPAASLPAEPLGPPLPVTYIGTETRTRQTVEDYSEEAPRIDNEELDPLRRGYF